MSVNTQVPLLGEDQQHYSLKWNDYATKLASAFLSLKDKNDFIDVTVACDGQRYSAHRMVLSACSPYFRAILRSNPCQHPIIILRDVSHLEFERLLEFMYNGEVNIAQQQLAGFLRTAEALKIRGLAGGSDDLEMYGDESPNNQEDKCTEKSAYSYQDASVVNSRVNPSTVVTKTSKNEARVTGVSCSPFGEDAALQEGSCASKKRKLMHVENSEPEHQTLKTLKIEPADTVVYEHSLDANSCAEAAEDALSSSAVAAASCGGGPAELPATDVVSDQSVLQPLAVAGCEALNLSVRGHHHLPNNLQPYDTAQYHHDSFEGGDYEPRLYLVTEPLGVEAKVERRFDLEGVRGGAGFDVEGRGGQVRVRNLSVMSSVVREDFGILDLTKDDFSATSNAEKLSPEYPVNGRHCDKGRSSRKPVYDVEGSPEAVEHRVSMPKYYGAQAKLKSRFGQNLMMADTVPPLKLRIKLEQPEPKIEYIEPCESSASVVSDTMSKDAAASVSSFRDAAPYTIGHSYSGQKRLQNGPLNCHYKDLGCENHRLERKSDSDSFVSPRRKMVNQHDAENTGYTGSFRSPCVPGPIDYSSRESSPPDWSTSDDQDNKTKTMQEIDLILRAEMMRDHQTDTARAASQNTSPAGKSIASAALIAAAAAARCEVKATMTAEESAGSGRFTEGTASLDGVLGHTGRIVGKSFGTALGRSLSANGLVDCGGASNFAPNKRGCFGVVETNNTSGQGSCSNVGKVYPCSECHKVFRHPMSLHHHRHVHRGTYTCHSCAKVFSRRWDLHRHLHRSKLGCRRPASAGAVVAASRAPTFSSADSLTPRVCKSSDDAIYSSALTRLESNVASVTSSSECCMQSVQNSTVVSSYSSLRADSVCDSSELSLSTVFDESCSRTNNDESPSQLDNSYATPDKAQVIIETSGNIAEKTNAIVERSKEKRQRNVDGSSSSGSKTTEHQFANSRDLSKNVCPPLTSENDQSSVLNEKDNCVPNSSIINCLTKKSKLCYGKPQLHRVNKNYLLELAAAADDASSSGDRHCSATFQSSVVVSNSIATAACASSPAAATTATAFSACSAPSLDMVSNSKLTKSSPNVSTARQLSPSLLTGPSN